MEDLNATRLLVARDMALPAGVVRCVDCGRFVSEEALAHTCPFPQFVAAGFGDELARRLAHAGFDDPHEARVWRRVVDQLGAERAGLWKASGVGPFDAMRSERAGLVPDYPSESPDLASQVAAVAERVNLMADLVADSGRPDDQRAVQLDRFELAARTSNDDLKRILTTRGDEIDMAATWVNFETDAVVDEVTAVGHLIAADIDGRYDQLTGPLNERHARITAQLRADLETGRVPPGAVSTVIAAAETGDDTALAEAMWAEHTPLKRADQIAALETKGLEAAAATAFVGSLSWPYRDPRTVERIGDLCAGHREALVAAGVLGSDIDTVVGAARLGDRDTVSHYMRLVWKHLDIGSAVGPAQAMVDGVSAARSALRELESERRRLRAHATVETLGTLRPLGGDLAAEVSTGSQETVDRAVAMFPASWVEGSAVGDPPLKIELLSGFDHRAHYRHRTTRRGAIRVERQPPEPETCSVRLVRGSAAEPTSEDMDALLRRWHPEAFSEEEWRKAGRRRGRRATARLSNIRNVRWDPGSQQLTYDCDREKVTRTRDPARSLSLIRTDRSIGSTAHELAHRFENTMPGLQRLATRWRNRRADGAELQKVGPGRDEWGRDGGFVDAYIGKEYVTGDTEVVSVGVQAIFGGELGGLVGDGGHSKTDPDHRAFTLGLLATFGRDRPAPPSTEPRGDR